MKLEIEHAIPLPESENVKNEKLTHHLKTHKLFIAIIKSNFYLFALSIFLGMFSVLLEFTGPVYMELLIRYLSSEDKPLDYGLLLAGSFTVITLLYPGFNTQRNFYSELMGIRVRNSLYNLIYNKTIMSTNLPEGLGVNLLQVDVNKIYEFFWFFPYLINIPIQIGIAIYLIYSQVGNAV